MVHDWCYTINVYNKDGHLVTHEEVVSQMNCIAADVQRRLGAGEEATPISVLTGNDRDSWARVNSFIFALLKHST